MLRWESNHFETLTFPWFQIQLSKHSGTTGSTGTFELASSEGLATPSVPWPWRKGDIDEFFGAFRRSEDEIIPVFPSENYNIIIWQWKNSHEWRFQMYLLLKMVKLTAIAMWKIRGGYHWNAAVWNPTILGSFVPSLAGWCSDAISWWRILAAEIEGSPSATKRYTCITLIYPRNISISVCLFRIAYTSILASVLNSQLCLKTRFLVTAIQPCISLGNAPQSLATQHDILVSPCF